MKTPKKPMARANGGGGNGSKPAPRKNNYQPAGMKREADKQAKGFKPVKTGPPEGKKDSLLPPTSPRPKPAMGGKKMTY